MGAQLLTDELWTMIEPRLPRRGRRMKGGRPRIPDRRALIGILFVLKTGIRWEDLPTEMGCGSGMTCLRRLRDWQVAGVWPEIRRVLNENMRNCGQVDWSRAEMESSFLPVESERFTKPDPEAELELLG
jgi:transposase